MNSENKNISETISDILRQYNNTYPIFREYKMNNKDKVKFVIEDSRKIRFIELADNIIEQDVFEENKELDLINKVPKKRGRPRKTKIMDSPLDPEIKDDKPKEPKKRGRPRKLDIDVKEGENRKYKYIVMYHKNRRANDEEFKERLKQKRREQYQKNTLEARMMKAQANKIRENLMIEDHKEAETDEEADPNKK